MKKKNVETTLKTTDTVPVDSYVVCFNFSIYGQHKYNVVINCVQKNNYTTTHVTDVAGIPDKVVDVVNYIRRQSLNLAASGVFDMQDNRTDNGMDNRAPKLYLAINDTEHQFNNAFEVRNLVVSYYYLTEATVQTIPSNMPLFSNYIIGQYQQQLRDIR